jgi:hypothetical protein
MANQPPQPAVTDPDRVGELFCDGPINVSVFGNNATFTFTHVRPDATPLFRDGTGDPVVIVRARVVIPVRHLTALRDLLNRVTDVTAPSVGGSTRH